jgi:colanic acid/amylovoran biosynthesis glycosyltransferase
MTMVYVLGAFPKVSETFITGQIAELDRQGVDLAVFSLQRPKIGGPSQPEEATVLPFTRYLPTGRSRMLPLAAAALAALVRTPRRAAPAMWWAARRSLAGRTTGDLLRFGQAAYIAKRLPASASHIHAHFAHGPATCAALVSRLSGVPYSFTAHARDIFEYGDKQGVHDKVAAAATVIAISRHGSRRVIDLAGAEFASRVQVVPNGIDLSRFRQRAVEPVGTPQVLCVARLVEKKGQDTLLRAIAMLAREGRRLRCELVGDGPLREHLEAEAEWLGIADLVTFSGAQDANGVLAAYQAATVFVLPCQVDSNGDQDGLPVSLVEAMAVGVPVISTRISGIPELIEEEVSGLLVEQFDARALAEAIARMLDEPELRAAMTTQARRVAETYDRTVTTQRFMDVTGIRELADVS